MLNKRKEFLQIPMDSFDCQQQAYDIFHLSLRPIISPNGLSHQRNFF
jgi:hypothetical protein